MADFGRFWPQNRPHTRRRPCPPEIPAHLPQWVLLGRPVSTKVPKRSPGMSASVSGEGRRADGSGCGARAAMDKRRLGTAITRYSLNPLVKALAGIGPLPFGMALLETVGRKSGEPRRVPVGGRLRNGAFWFVAEHGRRAAYVRNIVANPRVRVKVDRRWLAGTAVLPR